jgi:riboflavin kinase / FMN adenylyltransferase
MQIIRGLINIPPFPGGVALSIGNFDGVHLGHQYVLGELAEKADRLGISAGVMIFEPQPLEFFKPDKSPPRLSRLREKLRLLARLNLDFVVIGSFNQKFSRLAPHIFIEDILLGKLNVKHLVVGDDFHFGYQRQGNFAMLEDYATSHQFSVEAMRGFSIDTTRVSSTVVRELLSKGHIEKANDLLGRPYRMCGRIIHGHKNGRTIGFPTANINPHRRHLPLSGVFVVEMFGLEQAPIRGIANLGTRPTLNGIKPSLEVHLFNFDRNIYGRYVSVDFLHKIRDEQKFASLDALRQHIALDVTSAKEFWEIEQENNDE